MMSEDDTELRDVVAQTLEGNGVLGNIRAQLRACVFLALEEHDTKSSKSPFENTDLKEFLKTKRGKLSFSLIKQILEHFNLQHTLSVLQPEANLDDDLLETSELIKELSLPKNNQNGPLLGVLVERLNFNPQLNTQSSESTVFPEDLTTQQVDEARKQFRHFDKDQSGYIDKDELRNLFQTMFPTFNKSMIERYVNDEFRASDIDFSNGIDFDEFLVFYRRLFVQCRGVVSGSMTSLNNSNERSTISAPTRKLRKSNDSDSQVFAKGDTVDDDDDDADFFDDPLPDNGATKSSIIAGVGAAATSNGQGGRMTSLKDMPSLSSGGDTNKQRTKNTTNSIGHELAEIGLDELNTEHPDYQDDFDDSPSLKTLSVRSEKSKKSQGSIEEEIDEIIEVEDENVNSQSVVEDVTIDSDRSLGIDYVEEAKR